MHVKYFHASMNLHLKYHTQLAYLGHQTLQRFSIANLCIPKRSEIKTKNNQFELGFLILLNFSTEQTIQIMSWIILKQPNLCPHLRLVL